MVSPGMLSRLVIASRAVPHRPRHARAVDSAGRIFRRVLSPSGQAQVQLWLDPTVSPEPSAALKISSRSAFSGPIGDFAGAVNYNLQTGLTLELGSWVRGLGFARSSPIIEAGSSGGFSESYELVYANLGGQLVFATPAQSLALSAESTALDVTGHHVTNCAVPCYFAACGLAPGGDPAGTYKPCFAVSLRVADGRLSDSNQSAQVVLDLLDSAGRPVVHDTACPKTTEQPRVLMARTKRLRVAERPNFKRVISNPPLQRVLGLTTWA